jgi:UPF0042 nucleotide-binding protein
MSWIRPHSTNSQEGKTVKLISFAYKTEGEPAGAKVFDCRGLRNPHGNLRLRVMTGKDKDVQEFVKNDPKFETLLVSAIKASVEYPAIAFGCFGGRHRSVALAEMLASALRATGETVEVQHTAL